MAAQLVRDIRNLDVVHDDVLVEDGKDFLHLRLVGVNQQRLSPIVGVQIAQDMSLRIEQKSVYPVPGLEIADIVGDHAVQPARPVAASKRNLGSRAQDRRLQTRKPAPEIRRVHRRWSAMAGCAETLSSFCCAITLIFS